MSKARKLGQLGMVLGGLLLPAASASAAVPLQDAGAPAGPLNHVIVGNSLGCQAQHTGDSVFEFFPQTVSPGDCGTLLFAAGVLFTPDFSNQGSTFTSGLGARTPFTPVSQTGVTGNGSSGDPFKIVTVVAAAATGLRITETDTYVAGQESYRTDVTVANTGASNQSVILYRAADCFLQNADSGFGFAEAGNAVGCSATANNSPPDRIMEWVPITGGNNFTENYFATVWSQIGAHTAFPNTCGQCTTKT